MGGFGSSPTTWTHRDASHRPRRSTARQGRGSVPICPISGKELRKSRLDAHSPLVPTDPALIERVAASTGLTPAEAARVVEDVLAFHAEPVEDYVRRRHTELKTYGARNPQIFARIAEELADRVVAAPRLTERQLRRVIYG